jgi:cytochrome c oxidase subunit 3
MSTASLPHPHDTDLELGAVGMWIFLATELLFFGGLFLAYTYGRSHWPAGFAAAGAHTHLWIGTINTALLLSSSAVVALAAERYPEPALRSAVPWLLAGAVALGLGFLGLKGLEYMKEWHEHLVPGPDFALGSDRGAQLFFMLYYLMTALHALHMLVGVGVLGAFAWGTAKMKPWALPRRLEVAGLYWHFVDLVWIVLYPLLYLLGRSG